MGAWILAATLALVGTLDTNEAFQEGVTLYQELEFEQAIFRFESAALSADLTDQERAMVFGWMAMSYAGVGKVDGAKRSLKNALAKDPDVTLPQFAPPKVKEWLAEVRAEMPPSSGRASPGKASPGTSSAADGESLPTSASDGEASSSPSSSTSSPAAPSSSGEGAKQEAASEDYETGRTSFRQPTEEVEEFTLPPEQPEESSGATLGGILMMGGGAGAVVIAAVAAVPAALFIFDALYIVQPVLDDIGPNHPDYDAYAQAQTTDFIVGGSLSAVGAVFAALGIGLVIIGAGAATYGLLE
jgi:tetratricopeptide (TPR) repeat protein